MDSETYFGPWVKRRRKALGLTQKELAERVGCSVITIHKIETEERRPSRQIAELLAVSLEIPLDEREAFVRYARRERAGSLSELPSKTLSAAAAQNFFPSSIPASLTPLIGRQPELAAINRLLLDPACRLLTLLGTAGVGKTRLALEVAQRYTNLSQHFPDGVCFVTLANVRSPAHLPSAIASAIGLIFSGPEEPEAQLLSALQDKEALFVLDGLEHVINGAGLLAKVLQTATRLKLLVTSRERLNLNSEWVFEIHGLPIPKEGEVEDPEVYSAVQLFVQHARQIRPDFVLNLHDRRDVIRICQLVDGLPLAIELAAAWVRLLSCHEIANEIEDNLDFLTTSARDVPERHRSLRAAFEHSWNLITEEEQLAVKRLSVFRGGFRREAALQVAGATLPMLSALADKSLLKLAGAGRYDMHDLLRQYAASHLAGDPQHYYRMRDRHARYYLDLLVNSGNTHQAMGHKQLIADLQGEIANLRLAWEWVLEHLQLAEVHRTTRSLARLYEFLSWRKEGEQMFRQAIQIIENRPHLDGDEQYDSLQASVLAQLKVYLSWMVYLQGRLGEALELLNSSIPILRSSSSHGSIEERKVLADGLVFSGFVLHAMGENTAAREAVQEFLSDSGEVGDRWINAVGRTILGSILNAMGERQAARDSLRQGLAIYREMDDSRGTAFCLVVFGQTLYEMGNLEEARQVLTESLVLSRMTGDTWNEGFALNQLGLLAMQREAYQEAFDLLSESYDLFHELGERWGSGRVLSSLGDAALALHFPAKAEYYFLEAIKIASTDHAYPIALQAVSGLAQILAQRDKPCKALEFALHALQHPAAAPETKARADRLTAELDGRISEEEAALIKQQLKDKPLDLLLEEILATHWELPM